MSEMVNIPASWQQLHWKQQVALANEIQAANGKPEVSEAAQARVIVENEARRRAADPLAKIPAADPREQDDSRTVPVRLLRDTWEGETRVRADGNVTMWSLEDAKRMIASGVAERADPLPGE